MKKQEKKTWAEPKLTKGESLYFSNITMMAYACGDGKSGGHVPPVLPDAAVKHRHHR